MAKLAVKVAQFRTNKCVRFFLYLRGLWELDFGGGRRGGGGGNIFPGVSSLVGGKCRLFFSFSPYLYGVGLSINLFLQTPVRLYWPFFLINQ